MSPFHARPGLDLHLQMKYKRLLPFSLELKLASVHTAFFYEQFSLQNYPANPSLPLISDKGWDIIVTRKLICQTAKSSCISFPLQVKFSQSTCKQGWLWNLLVHQMRLQTKMKCSDKHIQSWCLPLSLAHSCLRTSGLTDMCVKSGKKNQIIFCQMEKQQ